MPAVGASGNSVRWRVATLTERNALTISPDEVGFLTVLFVVPFNTVIAAP